MNQPANEGKSGLAKLKAWWPEIVCFLGAAIFLGVALALRKIIFFRDYAIIWDGAVRMLQGQYPFADFGMPTGPVSLFLPYLFFKLFGVSWPVFQAAQFLINLLLLANLLWLQIQLGEQRWIRLSSAVLFTLCYLLLLTHPWYNTTALLLAMTGFNLLLMPDLWAKVVAGAVAALCIFTKQDFGGLFILSALLLLFWNASMQRRALAQVGKELLLGASAFGVVCLIICLAYDSMHLSYWFNYGQAPHVRRSLSSANLLDWTFLIGCAFLLMSYGAKSKALLVYGLLVLMSWVTNQTSGLYFTHYYGLLAAIPLLTLGFREPRVHKLRLVLPAIALMLVWRPLMHSSAVLLNVVQSQPEHYFFAAGLLPVKRPQAIDLGQCNAVMSHIYGPADICELQTLVNEKIHKGKTAAKGQILNMTELTPLTWTLNMQAPLHHPLWYDPNVLYFSGEHARLLEEIDVGKFDLILLQGTHSGFTSIHAQVLKVIEESGRYEQASKVYASPSNLTDCGFAFGCQIHVFWRAPTKVNTDMNAAVFSNGRTK
jgi:hypothetical protein